LFTDISNSTDKTVQVIQCTRLNKSSTCNILSWLKTIYLKTQEIVHSGCVESVSFRKCLQSLDHSLTMLQMDNRGNRLIVTDDSAINTPAVAAAHAIRRYSAKALDEISFEVSHNFCGDFLYFLFMKLCTLTSGHYIL